MSKLIPTSMNRILLSFSCLLSVNAVIQAQSEFCGDGTLWDDASQTCVIDSTQFSCLTQPIDNSCYFDVSGNGVVGPEDLLSFLASFASTCEANLPPWACGDPLQYQGYDYATVLIGEQCWFAENLRAENYSNGDTVISQSDESSWVTTVIGSTGVYGDGVVPCAHSCGQPEVSLFEFGRLYNWWAVTDERNVCATGWHVPSNDEWLEMEGFVQALVGDSVSFALKSASGWLPVGDQVGNGTNQFGMNILASGNRDVNQQELTAIDANVGSQASFWTTSSHNSEFGLFRYYHHLIPEPSVGLGAFQSGLYVRCIKD